MNLPAHLVIIKSTQQYLGGEMLEYPEGQIIQMMGRAGRPQFDTSATAVIMTKESTKVAHLLSLNCLYSTNETYKLIKLLDKSSQFL